MGFVRDFTGTAKQGLLETMQEIEEQDNSFWIFSGLFDAISSASICENIAFYQGDIDAYHRAMLDKKNTSVEQLQVIWTNVYEVDGRYARSFQDLADRATALKAVFDGLADALDPNYPGANGVPALFGPRNGLKGFLKTYESPEYAADHRMQDEALALLKDDPRFSRETWDAADEAERQRILQEYYDKISKIMGTDAAPEIAFEPLESYRGVYDPGSRQIKINSDLLLDSNSYILFRTVMHENRHAYQYETIDNPGCHIVSDDTRRVWRNNRYAYIKYQDDPQGYFEQPLEWDARGFAGQQPRGPMTAYDGSWEDE